MPLPEHFQLLAGYVTVSSQQTEEKDDCGNVRRVIETINRNWIAYPYDIRAQPVGNIKRVFFIGRQESKDT